MWKTTFDCNLRVYLCIWIAVLTNSFCFVCIRSRVQHHTMPFSFLSSTSPASTASLYSSCGRRGNARIQQSNSSSLPCHAQATPASARGRNSIETRGSLQQAINTRAAELRANGSPSCRGIRCSRRSAVAACGQFAFVKLSRRTSAGPEVRTDAYHVFLHVVLTYRQRPASLRLKCGNVPCQ